MLRQPEATAQAPPADAALAVEAGDAYVDGGFAELATANAAFVASLAHRHVTLGQLYEARRGLEQAYARRGYILVRVTVPPQRLEPGGPLRVIVIDGFVEDIDLAHLAAPLRGAVGARLRPLVGRRHVTQGEIERALLVAGDVAGARLRSAIAPGDANGGVHLVVEGNFVRVEGQVGADNSLPASLGRWQVTGNVTLNEPLGLGDQLYLSVGSQADVGHYGFPKAALAMIGGGYVLPLGNDGATLTGEYLTSRTQPNPVPGVPLSAGNFTRARISVRIPAIRTRDQTLALTSSYELITQSEKLPQFAVQVSRDHYLAWRLGVDWQRDFGSVPVSLNATVSHGLAGRDGSVSLPTSRQGATPEFADVEGTAHASLPWANGFMLDLTARGKTGFGKPLYLSEQFALDTVNGVSSFPSGSFNVDSGASLRGELRYPPLVLGKVLTLAPYLFGAGGWGWVARPTAAEQGYITAASAGLGTRLDLSGIGVLKQSGVTISVEFGHQFSNVAGRANGERATVSAALRF